jgi:hypothetical protein
MSLSSLDPLVSKFSALTISQSPTPSPLTPARVKDSEISAVTQDSLNFSERCEEVIHLIEANKFTEALNLIPMPFSEERRNFFQQLVYMLLEKGNPEKAFSIAKANISSPTDRDIVYMRFVDTIMRADKVEASKLTLAQEVASLISDNANRHHAKDRVRMKSDAQDCSTAEEREQKKVNELAWLNLKEFLVNEKKKEAKAFIQTQSSACQTYLHKRILQRKETRPDEKKFLKKL